MRNKTRNGNIKIMQARVLISAVASLVYLFVYAGVSRWQGEYVTGSELVLSTVAFFAVFFIVRTWLDRMRAARGSRRKSE